MTTLLQTLPVKGRAPKSGYSREAFGDGWVDIDHNGCDSRNDILNRDLTGTSHEPGTHECVVINGLLSDPYSGSHIVFLRGQDTSSDVQIDHVVALSDAWQKGAQPWDDARRTAFANDPLGLLAVDGPLNEQKGDGDAATWLPPDVSARCSYVARQVAVKAKWGLWMTAAERDAIARVLTRCPQQLAPRPTDTAEGVSSVASSSVPPSSTTAPPAVVSPPASSLAPAAVPVNPAPIVSAPEPLPSDDSGVSYKNCSAARAAGVAPILVGEPGYNRKLDRDGDGVACE